ncbi:MAG: hypothetical protein Kow0069_08480 [Promethearchaeota archaeon]
MSYVYMKALETAPQRYDKGIKWLGWGKLDGVREEIAELSAGAVEGGAGAVLELGCGTGTQALLLARRGLRVTGMDHSRGMLSVARDKLEELRASGPEGEEAAGRVTLLHKAVVELDEFPDASFDVVTSTLVFSELHDVERRYALAHAFRVLKPGGLLLLADEVVPEGRGKRVAHALVSAPLKFVTFALTQTTTRAVRDLTRLVEWAGFQVERVERRQLDSFQLVVAKKPEAAEVPEVECGLIDPPKGGAASTFWQTAARMVAHETEIGLIRVGNPTPDDPVVCTCNFKLTVRRVHEKLAGAGVNCWLLVAPTGGINVWCSACGDNFNAGSVITAIKVTGLDERVNHRRLVLPQLAAPGVDVRRVKQVTGWTCTWGPVHVDDLPEFLGGMPGIARHKPERMRKVRFSAGPRFEMAMALALPVLLLLGVPGGLALALVRGGAWAGWVVPYLAVLWAFPTFTFLAWPAWPAHSGGGKALAAALAFCAILAGASYLASGFGPAAWLPPPAFAGAAAALNWWPLMVLTALLALLTAMDADGMTPTLRSALGARAWNKGKGEFMERWGASYSATPYGRISVDLDKCTGCGNCEDVCPMLIPRVGDAGSESERFAGPAGATVSGGRRRRLVELSDPDSCVNCRACINQCHPGALFLAPETEAAKRSFENYRRSLLEAQAAGGAE